MIKYVKTKIVIGLEAMCGLTGHHWCHRLATSSARLDERWGTDVWSIVADDEQVTQ